MNSMEAVDALEQLINDGKSVPLSASVMISREEALNLVRHLRDELPKETDQAREVLSERESVLGGAQAEARKIVEDAKAERARLIARNEVVQAADREAKRIMEDAEAAAEKMKMQADDFVDAKLANFEILLNKVLRTVGRGREQLRRRLEAAQDEVPPLSLEDSGEISAIPGQQG